ncbi:hypothetical protein PPACK8108_LOCUS15339 [Phakopsora pachyrhizi]|uniref:Uncharacterized protein n=1 Tax=Phakopsora pachyrhizi TaxID=170000 RepID=A0AAV0B970_PHAPC|nr:hypothetical protein PPACK8108_LOCUS15339 [Phakopsora pachyrhizi]
MEPLDPNQRDLSLQNQSQERERKIKHLPKVQQSKQMERGGRDGSSPEGSLQKLSTLNSSFLNEIVNKMELLNENMVTSNKNFYNVLQQIYKACKSDPDTKSSRELAPEVSGILSVDARGFNLGGIYFSRQHPHIEHFSYSDLCPCQIGLMTRCPSRIAAAIAQREMKFKAGARSKGSVESESSSMQRFRKGWDKWWDNGRDETKKTVQVKDKKGYRVNKQESASTITMGEVKLDEETQGKNK